VLPASEDAPRAAVEASEAAASALLSPAAKEPVHLVDEHLQRPVSVLDAVGSRERVSSGEDAVGVHTRLAVQSVPDDRRQVEQNSLMHTITRSI